MLKLLAYLLSNGTVTQRNLLPDLDSEAKGIPKVTASPCAGAQCNKCAEECPTDAITLVKDGTELLVKLDRGACINCSICIDSCPSGTIVSDRSTLTAARKREDLILTNRVLSNGKNGGASSPDLVQSVKDGISAEKNGKHSNGSNPFQRSVAARVVSTGCSACDLEIGAAGNPIFDMERFGVHVVASPRFADVLIVTGPVPIGMQDPLKRCYEAMAEPRRVIAVGTCACSGGIHKGGYTEANGAAAVIPVDVFIPGCPPHPWSIIAGILLAMDRLPADKVKSAPSLHV